MYVRSWKYFKILVPDYVGFLISENTWNLSTVQTRYNGFLLQKSYVQILLWENSSESNILDTLSEKSLEANKSD